jgi:hypothetical protein
MTVTRYPSGVTNVTAENTLGGMGQPDPTKFHTYFNDFDTFLASDWTITAVGTGTTSLISGDGGLLSVVTSAAAPDSRAHQITVAGFTFTPGKKMFFKIACAISNATLSVFQAGLIALDTTPTDVTDGIYFLKPAATTNIGVFVRRDATTGNLSNTNIAQMTTDLTSFGFYYDGRETVEFYINDRIIGSLPATAVNFPDVAMAPLFFLGNGDAVARTLNVDYIFAAKER